MKHIIKIPTAATMVSGSTILAVQVLDEVILDAVTSADRLLLLLSRECDVSLALPLVEEVVVAVEETRDDQQFEACLKKAKDMIGVDVNEDGADGSTTKRICRLNVRREGSIVTSSSGGRSDEHTFTSDYFEVTDVFLTQLKLRFEAKRMYDA